MQASRWDRSSESSAIGDRGRGSAGAAGGALARLLAISSSTTSQVGSSASGWLVVADGPRRVLFPCLLAFGWRLWRLRVPLVGRGREGPTVVVVFFWTAGRAGGFILSLF